MTPSLAEAADAAIARLNAQGGPIFVRQRTAMRTVVADRPDMGPDGRHCVLARSSSASS